MLPLLNVPVHQDPRPVPSSLFEQRLLESSARDILEVPSEVLRIQETSLPRDPGRAAPNPRSRGRDNLLATERGMRLLLFDLAPGERIRFTLGGDGLGNLLLSIAPSAKPDGMDRETARVNASAPRFRARGLEIENVTATLYPLLLRITGPTGLPYSLEVVRKVPSTPLPSRP